MSVSPSVSETRWRAGRSVLGEAGRLTAAPGLASDSPRDLERLHLCLILFLKKSFFLISHSSSSL